MDILMHVRAATRIVLRGAVTGLILLTGCAYETGQPEVSVKATVTSNTKVAFDVQVPGGSLWKVTLREARVALGPMYFCASHVASSDICESAAAEIATSRAVDLLSPRTQPFGTLRGFAGDIRSVGFDYGIHWYLAQSSERVDAVAPHGHSAYFDASASSEGRVLTFVASVDVHPSTRGEHAVPTARVSMTLAEATQNTDEIRLAVEAHRWFANVDFDDLWSRNRNGESLFGPDSSESSALIQGMVAAVPTVGVVSRNE